MGNIANQFFILFIQKNFFLCGFLQTLAHFLEIPAQFGKLILPLDIQNEIQISLFNILCGFL